MRRSERPTDWQATSFTPLIGRAAELVEVARLLGSSRLVTLSGPGGVGKTRLAVEIAAGVQHERDSDVVFVDLAPVEDPTLVEAAVLAALGAGEQSGQDPLATAVALFNRGAVMVVVDNCEHLLNRACELVDVLLRHCPRLRILATSREPLGISGETIWRTPTLSLPDPNAVSPIEAVAESGAGALFVELASRRRPGFRVSLDNAEAIARICAGLDGLPLALELAAARVTMLTPLQIADGLSGRFQLLTGGPRSAPIRHRTLRASLDWSHRLLGEPEQILLRRCSVFRGGWILISARAVCAAAPLDADEIFDLTAALIDKSFVTVTEGRREMRYGLHESVREYATDKLYGAGEQDEVRSQWLAHFGEMAAAANETLNDDAGRAALDAEAANVRAALAYACESDPNVALDMTIDLARSWLMLDRHREGLAACARVLAVAGEGDAARRAFVHWAAGQFATFGQDYEAALCHAGEGLALAETTDDVAALSLCLGLMSSIVNWADPIEGARLAHRAVEVARGSRDEYALGLALANATFVEGMRDRFDDAASAYRQFCECPAAVRDPWLHALAEAAMAWTEVGHGDPRAAVEHADRALDGRTGDESMLAFIISSFHARARASLGHAREAHAAVTDALARARTSELSVAIPTLEVALLATELALGNLPEARALAEALRDEPALHTAAFAHDALTRISLAERDAAGAREHALALAEIARHTDSPRQQALADWALGAAALQTGDTDEARHRLHDALACQDANDLRGDVPDSLEALGTLALDVGDGRAAAALLGASVGARRALRCVAIPPADGRIQALCRRGDELLGEQEWSALFRRAQRLPLADAVSYARRGRGTRGRNRTGWASVTPTELQVIEYAAAGLTNAQIAARLLMSRSTVKAHLAHVYTKLGVRTRAQLATATATRPATA